MHPARPRRGDHRRPGHPDHRHRRGRALRRAGARPARPPRPLDRLDAAFRQALRGARPRGGACGRRVRGGGEGRPLPDRGAGLRAARGQGRLMQTILEPRTMQAWADATRARGERIALVPTMGALHEGHVALIAEARRRAKRVVVSVFVNPIQFDRRDDFERYPRTLDDDLRICATAGVDAVYAPSAAAMYAEGFQTAVEVTRLTEPLCGAARPGHFRGVTTVVTKLFHAVRPHLAVFGEKDWQQLAVVRRMAADLDFGIEIVGVPTVREADGLALSSRNRRLSAEEREAARCVPRALDAAAEMAATGETRPAMIVGRAKMEIAACPRARLEYAEVRDPETLEEVDAVPAPVQLGAAARAGAVRRIGNRPLAPADAVRESAHASRRRPGPPDAGGPLRGRGRARLGRRLRERRRRASGLARRPGHHRGLHLARGGGGARARAQGRVRGRAQSHP